MLRRAVSTASLVAALVAAGVVCWSCGGGGRSPAPGSDIPPGTPAPGATRVTGTERLVWNQPGEASGFRFRAYLDGNPVELAATCPPSPEPDCSAPLPAMANGLHTIALTAVNASGVESPRSEPVTVEKVSAAGVAVTTEAVADATSGGGLHVETIVSGPDGQAFAVDAVVRGLTPPLQMAPTPDGRLLVAEGDGRITMRYPANPARDGLALDARAVLDRDAAGVVGLAVAPDFDVTRFVYVSLVAPDGGAARLRIVRLREAGDLLGEPATLFEAPLVTVAPAGRALAGDEDRPSMPAVAASARLAFGPDRLLYVLLSPGVAFDREPAASRPLGSLVRLDAEGHAAKAIDLPAIGAYPLGLAWHPTTHELLAVFPGADGTAAITSVERGRVAGMTATAALAPDPRSTGHRSPGRLRFDPSDTSALPLGRAFVEGLRQPGTAAVRLTVPVVLDGLPGPLAGELVDVVAGTGTIYAAVVTSGPPASTGDRGGLVLRLRPR